MPLIFLVLGVIALLMAVWAVMFYILRSQRAEITAEDWEVEARTDFISKWRKGRSGTVTSGTDVEIIRPKQQPSASIPEKTDEVRSA